MSKVIPALFILCSLTLSAIAQNNRACLGAGDILLDPDKATVFITFERGGKTKPKYNDDSGDYVWLRLHNNTRWAITLYAMSGILLKGESFTSTPVCGGKRSALREGTEIDAEYYVEANAGSGVEAPEILRHDYLAGEAWLASGTSILFRVPREHLAKFLSIYVPFKYEWEKSIKGTRPEIKVPEDILKYEEPRHIVYFHYYQLPAFPSK